MFFRRSRFARWTAERSVGEGTGEGFSGDRLLFGNGVIESVPLLSSPTSSIKELLELEETTPDTIARYFLSIVGDVGFSRYHRHPLQACGKSLNLEACRSLMLFIKDLFSLPIWDVGAREGQMTG